MLVNLSGSITYDPPRKNFKKTDKTRTMIINVFPGDLAGYYNYFITKEHGPWMFITPPLFKYHVTVVGGREHVPDMSAWKKHEGKKITLSYDPASLSERFGFWYVSVTSPKLSDFRRELGIMKDPHFHLTIGRANVDRRLKNIDPAVFDQIIEMIPTVKGNQQLKDELITLQKAKRVFDESSFKDAFINTIFGHITDPTESSKSWERDVMELITS